MFYFFREKAFYYGLWAFAGVLILFSNLLPPVGGMAVAGTVFACAIAVFIYSFFDGLDGDIEGAQAKLLFLTPTATKKFMASRYIGTVCEILLLLLLVWLPFFFFSPIPATAEVLTMPFAFFPASEIVLMLAYGITIVASVIVIMYFANAVVSALGFSGNFFGYVAGFIAVVVTYNIWQWVLALPLIVMGNTVITAATMGFPVSGLARLAFAVHINTGPSIFVYFATNIALIVAGFFATSHILEKYVSIGEE